MIICKMLISFRNYVEETTLVLTESEAQVKLEDRGKSQGRSTFPELSMNKLLEK